MSLDSGPLKLKSAMKKLRINWDELEAQWNDKVRKEFEETHLDPIEYQVTATLRAMDRLAEILRRAEQDCT